MTSFDHRAVERYFAERAAGVDAAELDVRDGLRWLAQRDLLAIQAPTEVQLEWELARGQ